MCFIAEHNQPNPCRSGGGERGNQEGRRRYRPMGRIARQARVACSFSREPVSSPRRRQKEGAIGRAAALRRSAAGLARGHVVLPSGRRVDKESHAFDGIPPPQRRTSGTPCSCGLHPSRTDRCGRVRSTGEEAAAGSRRPTSQQQLRRSSPQARPPSSPQARLRPAPQALRPSSPQALRPSSPQALRPSSPQALRPSSPQALRPSSPQAFLPHPAPRARADSAP